MPCLQCGKVSRNRKFCSNKCQKCHEYDQYIARWKAGVGTDLRSGLVSNHINKYLRIKYSNRCGRCGWDIPHPLDGIPPLEVEHIDGNWRNNTEDNLILLCPNCHSLTSTYRGRNKGRGRPMRSGAVV
jgi:hypothetical protein